MKSAGKFSVRDYTFRETVSCPLKLRFLQNEDYNDQRDDLFRRRTKQILRESVAHLFPNVQFTSGSTSVAEEETKTWLTEDVVSICGAVLRFGSLRSRVPILLKEGKSVTIIQVHGKALKGDPSSLFSRSPIGRSLHRYLFQAAYRYHVVHSVLPDSTISCEFIFPQKSFKARSNHLYQRTQGARHIGDDALDELQELFVKVDGTARVKEVMNSIPGDLSHSWFTGNSLEEALEKMSLLDETMVGELVEHVHLGCRNCRFRKPVNQHEKGCWEAHFPETAVQNSDKHLFELIGHHVSEDHLIEEKYQENVSHSGDFSDAGKVIQHTDKKIAIYHRKAMQLLDARNHKLPLIFAKEMLNDIAKLKPPLHFIDFEAATHPVPAEKGKRPYDAVLFQFSCHTLLTGGELVHTQWLDREKLSNPHTEIIEALQSVPDLDKGTIIQFSPFERQAFYKLYNEIKHNENVGRQQAGFLKNVLKIGEPEQKSRFLDISVLLKDAYYNRYMNSGLSLKEILYSVLRAEDTLNSLSRRTYEIEGVMVDLFKKENGKIIDPYYQLSDDRSRIRDGITAMHAYLCMKAGELSKTQEKLVPVLMKRYCSMDSLGVYLIYRHIKNLAEMNKAGGDLVIEG